MIRANMVLNMVMFDNIVLCHAHYYENGLNGHKGTENISCTVKYGETFTRTTQCAKASFSEYK